MLSNTSIQPLPIAAAHHPSSLKALRAPVITSGKNKSTTVPSSENPDTSTKSHAEIILSAEVKASEKVQIALKDALERARKVGEEMKASLGVLRAKRAKSTHRQLDLWKGPAGRPELDLHVRLSISTTLYEG